jgi:hypothetical protein
MPVSAANDDAGAKVYVIGPSKISVYAICRPVQKGATEPDQRESSIPVTSDGGQLQESSLQLNILISFRSSTDIARYVAWL